MSEVGPITGVDYVWTVADVAKHLVMSESWVYKQAELGRLPCFRFGSSLRFSSLAIKNYVREQLRTR